MTQRTATFYKRPYNAYVPAATFAAYVVDKGNGLIEVDLGAPTAASAAAILSGQSIATASDTVTAGVPLLLNTIVDEFGRNVTVVADGAATSTVTVFGRDYLGQPMTETLTLNGTTTVPGGKAFKFIDRIAWGATASRNINVGIGARFGLPFRTSQVVSEIVNSVVGTVGTFTAGVLTDPQTATTGDPRGLYTPNGTVNGTNRFRLATRVDNFVNAAGNGGLYGIRHFA